MDNFLKKKKFISNTTSTSSFAILSSEEKEVLRNLFNREDLKAGLTKYPDVICILMLALAPNSSYQISKDQFAIDALGEILDFCKSKKINAGYTKEGISFFRKNENRN